MPARGGTNPELTTPDNSLETNDPLQTNQRKTYTPYLILITLIITFPLINNRIYPSNWEYNIIEIFKWNNLIPPAETKEKSGN